MTLLVRVVATYAAFFVPLMGGLYLVWDARGRPLTFFTRWVRALVSGEVH